MMPHLPVPQPYDYQFVSSLSPDAPTYVRRQADQDFYGGLMAGEFCDVLNLRQMGKSSLQVAKRATELERKGVALLQLPASKMREIEALLGAIEMGQELRGLLRGTEARSDVPWLEDCPAVSLMLGLRSSVNSVMEENSFRGEGERIALSPDDQSLVTYSYGDSRSRLYHSSGKELAQFEGNIINFSPDGQRLVTHSDRDSKIHLYDLLGKELAPLEGVFSDFTPDGQRLITYAYDHLKSHLYDLSGKELAQFEGVFMNFSPDG
jgi:hypothetical protein